FLGSHEVLTKQSFGLPIKKLIQRIEILSCTSMTSPFNKLIWGTVEAKLAFRISGPVSPGSGTRIGGIPTTMLAVQALSRGLAPRSCECQCAGAQGARNDAGNLAVFCDAFESVKGTGGI